MDVNRLLKSDGLGAQLLRPSLQELADDLNHGSSQAKDGELPTSSSRPRRPSQINDTQMNYNDNFKDNTVKDNYNADKARNDAFPINLEDVLRFEFSGKLNFHLVGSTQEDGIQSTLTLDQDVDVDKPISIDVMPQAPTTKPLLAVRQPWPNVFLGVNYNLSKLDETRVSSTIQWLPQQMRRVKRKLIPSSLHVCVEKKLLPIFNRKNPSPQTETTNQVANDDIRAEFAVQWGSHTNRDYDSTSSMTARLESLSRSSLSVVLPIHKRLFYEYRLLADPDVAGNELPELTVDRQASSSQQDDANPGTGASWWLPELTVRASGEIESNNEGVFVHPLNKDRRISFRLVSSSQLLQRLFMGGNNFFGDADAGHGTDTRFCLELQDVGRRSLRGVRMEAELERPVQSFRLSLLHHVARERWR